MYYGYAVAEASEGEEKVYDQGSTRYEATEELLQGMKTIDLLCTG